MNYEQKVTDEPRRILAGDAKTDTAKREKTWEECGIEEKVERLRQQLRMHRDMNGYTRQMAGRALDLAQNHQHNPATGEVLKPAKERHGGEESGGSSFDPLR